MAKAKGHAKAEEKCGCCCQDCCCCKDCKCCCGTKCSCEEGCD